MTAAWMILAAPRRVELSFGGLRRTYEYVAPRATDRPAPLIVLLHGWTSNGREVVESTEIEEDVRVRGWALAAPNGLNSGWNAGFIDLSGKGADDVGFVGAVIDDVATRAKIDRSRVYVVGHSNGAMLAYSVGSRLSTKVAAIVVVSGSLGVVDGGKWRIAPKPEKPVDALIIHGKRDPIVAYDRGSRAFLVGLSAPDSALRWARAIGADSEPTKSTIRGAGWIERYRRNGHEVDFVTLTNGFHDWPGGAPNGHRETKSGFAATPYILRWLAARPTTLR